MIKRTILTVIILSMLVVILAFFFNFLMNAQTIDFNTINSANILNITNSPKNNINPMSSKSEITQLGNNNNAMIYDKSSKSDLIVRQTGDYNTTLITNTNPSIENKQKVNVEGSNNYIDITGNNSNSKDMQLNLKTNDKMIFVRHY